MVIMDSRSAEDHLRVIRELMERATIYRTISAPAALFCGLLALVVAFAALIPGPLQPILRDYFVQVWIIVFLLSALANTLFLLRSSKEREEAFPSRRLRTALVAIAPAFLVAGALTISLVRSGGSEIFVAVCWIGLYGMALLSTVTFAPRSIAVLGWAFVLTSCLCLGLLTQDYLFAFTAGRQATLQGLGYFAMAGTFGFYHIVYGVAVMARRHGNG
jgi:hypothetical protein